MGKQILMPENLKKIKRAKKGTKKAQKLKAKIKAYNTWYSQAVTHPSTNQARDCLTSVIGRELVHSIRYGRRHLSTSCDAYLRVTMSDLSLGELCVWILIFLTLT